MRLLLVVVLLLVFRIPVSAQGAIDHLYTGASTDSFKIGQYVRVVQIVTSGNKRTRKSIIMREISVAEGSVVNADSLSFLANQSRLRLLNLSLFTEVSVHFTKFDDSGCIMHIRVKERWYIWPEVSFQLADRNFNVWWREQHRDLRRANLGVSLTDKNFRGNMESLAGTVQIGYTEKFALSYFRPYIDKAQRHGLGANVSFARNPETYYITDSNKLKFVKRPDGYILSQLDAALIYTFRPQYASRHLIQLSFRDYKVGNEIVTLNPDYYKNGSNELKMFELSYRVDVNKVDNWNYPLKGFKVVSYTSSRMGIKGIKFQAYSMLEASLFRQLNNSKWYYSSVLRGRLTFPEDQPYAFRNAMGTRSEYVRGYEYYVVDGSQYGIVRFDFKRELFNHTFKKIPVPYLPSIPVRIYPKVFADAGYARNKYPGNSFLNNRMLYSAGVGVDIITAYDIKARFEYVVNHLGQFELYFHLNSE